MVGVGRTIQKFDLFERRLRIAQEPTGSGQILRSVGEKRGKEGGGIKNKRVEVGVFAVGIQPSHMCDIFQNSLLSGLLRHPLDLAPFTS